LSVLKSLTFFRACLLVPYAFAALIQLSLPLLPGNLAEPWLTILLYGLLAIVVGGIPYSVIALVLWIWLPGKSSKAVRIALAAAPLGLLAVVLVFPSLRFAWRQALLVSYTYVAVFLLTEQILRRLGFVRDRAVAAPLARAG
jgi:hypothetical protein